MKLLNFFTTIIKWQFLPISLFVLLSRGTTIPILHIFLASGIVAMIHLCLLKLRKIDVDLFFLGANAFLIGGGLAVILAHVNIPQFLIVYGILQEATFFLALTFVGLASTIFNKNGFIDTPGAKKCIQIYSCKLLIFSALSTLIVFAVRFILSSMSVSIVTTALVIAFIKMREHFRQEMQSKST